MKNREKFTRKQGKTSAAAAATNPLMLYYDEDEGGWLAVIPNVEKGQMVFAGDTYDEQFQSVQELATAMAEGEGELDSVILGLFKDIPDEVTPGDLVQGMFGYTDELWLGDAVVTTAPEDEVLLDILEVAGEALLALL